MDISQSTDDTAYEDIVCDTCRKGDREEYLILCDGCPGNYHIDCLDPPLPKVPKGDWLCPHCAKMVAPNPKDVKKSQVEKPPSRNKAAEKTRSSEGAKPAPPKKLKKKQVRKSLIEILSSDDEFLSDADSTEESEKSKPKRKKGEKNRLEANKPKTQPEAQTARESNLRRKTSKKSYADHTDNSEDDFSSYGGFSPPKKKKKVLGNQKCGKCGSRGESLLPCTVCKKPFHSRCFKRKRQCEQCVAYSCALCKALLDRSKNDVLSCERCRSHYHKTCLATPFEGSICADCIKEEKYTLGGREQHPIQAIWDKRESLDHGIKSNEYLVQWKGKANIYDTWLSERRVKLIAPRLIPGFELREEEDPAKAQYRREIYPGFHHVDRIVAQSDSSYLVKWVGVSYESATWESKKTILKLFQGPEALDAYTSYSSVLVSRQKILKGRKKPLPFKPKKPTCISLLDPREEKNSHSEGNTPKKSKGSKESGSQEVVAASDEEGSTETSSFRVVYRKQPEFIEGKLFTYQITGVNFLHSAWESQTNVILADEMGLGKTIQTIAYILSIRHAEGNESDFRPVLIVVPLSTCDNWLLEFKRWAPKLNVILYHGTAEALNVIKQYEMSPLSEEKYPVYDHQGKEQSVFPVRYDAIVTSYQYVAKDTSLKKVLWESLVVDEGHRLKNEKSNLFQDLACFQSRHRVILTGTPMQNNITELFTLLNFLDASYHIETLQKKFETLTDQEQIKQLHKLIRPRILRRLKTDVLKDMPEKKEQVLPVTLTKLQKQYYSDILTKNYNTLSQTRAQNKLYDLMSALKKCANHPYLFDSVEPDSFSKDEEMKLLIEASGKMKLLDQMLTRLYAEGGHRCLIFSQSVQMLVILEDYLTWKGWGYFLLDGAVDSHRRQHDIDQFNKGSTEMQFVYLISTKAGGLGINLAAADTVIIFDFGFNPHDELQNKVMVYQLVTSGTIEEAIWKRAQGKLLLETVVVQKMKDKTSEISARELNTILSFGAEKLFQEDQEETPVWAYNEEMLTKILDRTTEESPTDEHPTKLGSFELASVSAQAEEEALVEPTADFWKDLLEKRLEKMQEKEKTRFGRGKRFRAVATYIEKKQKLGSYSSEEGSNDSTAHSKSSSDSSQASWEGGSAQESSSDDSHFETTAVPASKPSKAPPSKSSPSKAPPSKAPPSKSSPSKPSPSKPSKTLPSKPSKTAPSNSSKPSKPSQPKKQTPKPTTPKAQPTQENARRPPFLVPFLFHPATIPHTSAPPRPDFLPFSAARASMPIPLGTSLPLTSMSDYLLPDRTQPNFSLAHRSLRFDFATPIPVPLSTQAALGADASKLNPTVASSIPPNPISIPAPQLVAKPGINYPPISLLTDRSQPTPERILTPFNRSWPPSKPQEAPVPLTETNTDSPAPLSPSTTQLETKTPIPLDRLHSTKEALLIHAQPKDEPVPFTRTQDPPVPLTALDITEGTKKKESKSVKKEKIKKVKRAKKPTKEKRKEREQKNKQKKKKKRVSSSEDENSESSTEVAPPSTKEKKRKREETSQGSKIKKQKTEPINRTKVQGKQPSLVEPLINLVPTKSTNTGTILIDSESEKEADREASSVSFPLSSEEDEEDEEESSDHKKKHKKKQKKDSEKPISLKRKTKHSRK